MLLLPLRATALRRAGLEPARRRSALPRSNRHLHHRLADVRRRTSTIAKGTLENRRYRLNLHRQRSSSREMRHTKLKNEFRRGALNGAPP
jgi:hypothetical protein